MGKRKYGNAKNKHTRGLQFSIKSSGLKSQKLGRRASRKRTLADCVVDGSLPKSVAVHSLKQQAKSATRKRLNKLDSHKKEPASRKFLPFEEARKYVHTLKLKSWEEWNQFCNSGALLENIPRNPWKTYKKEWKGVGNWLGTNTIAPQNTQFRPFEEAREFVRNLGLNNRREWERYCKSGKRPADIPSAPDRTYKNKGWKGTGDWLDTIVTTDQRYRKSTRLPKNIPQNIAKTCKNGTSGTSNAVHQKKKIKSFMEAREFIHRFRLRSRPGWKRYYKLNHPDRAYKKKDWPSKNGDK